MPVDSLTTSFIFLILIFTSGLVLPITLVSIMPDVRQLGTGFLSISFRGLFFTVHHDGWMYLFIVCKLGNYFFFYYTNTCPNQIDLYRSIDFTSFLLWFIEWKETICFPDWLTTSLQNLNLYSCWLVFSFGLCTRL